MNTKPTPLGASLIPALTVGVLVAAGSYNVPIGVAAFISLFIVSVWLSDINDRLNWIIRNTKNDQ
jgi:hypothetical protein